MCFCPVRWFSYWENSCCSSDTDTRYFNGCSSGSCSNGCSPNMRTSLAGCIPSHRCTWYISSGDFFFLYVSFCFRSFAMVIFLLLPVNSSALSIYFSFHFFCFFLSIYTFKKVKQKKKEFVLEEYIYICIAYSVECSLWFVLYV